MSRQFSIDIPTPCQVGWNSMRGDDTVRFCDLCHKNVFNLSDMTADEVADVMKQNEKRVCVSIRTRDNGSVYTDNCPRRWRWLRNRLRAYAPAMLVMSAWLFHQTAADAQGLVGAPVDPRFGTSGEVGGLADYKSESVRDITTILAGCTTIVTTLLAMRKLDAAKAQSLEFARAGECFAQTQAMLSQAWLLWIAVAIAAPLLVALLAQCALYMVLPN